MTTTAAEPGTAVAKRVTGNIAITADQDFWSPAQLASLKVLGIKDATNGDLAVYWHYCQRTRLDPFSKQIYMINRRTLERYQDDRGQWQERWVVKQTIQVGIDGFRVVRDRVAAEQHCEVEFEDTVWYDADGREHKVWLLAEAPTACKVVLIKHTENGRALRYPAVLRTASYMQTNKNGQPVSQWKTQAEHMIEKCCEAFATRRAFPNDFSGVFLEEEMNGRQDGDGNGHAPAHRKVTTADIIPATAPAPDDDEVADAEIVPEEDPGAGAVPVGKPPAPAPVTAQQVNDHFKRLGFTVKDQPQVLTAAAQLAGCSLPVKKVADLDPAELAVVHGRLESCGSRDDLVAMLAEIAADRAASEEADQAGGGDG